MATFDFFFLYDWLKLKKLFSSETTIRDLKCHQGRYHFMQYNRITEAITFNLILRYIDNVL
jgi:hypothetical protein